MRMYWDLIQTWNQYTLIWKLALTYILWKFRVCQNDFEIYMIRNPSLSQMRMYQSDTDMKLVQTDLKDNFNIYTLAIPGLKNHSARQNDFEIYMIRNPLLCWTERILLDRTKGFLFNHLYHLYILLWYDTYYSDYDSFVDIK